MKVYQADGSTREVDIDQIIYNDLSVAPVLDALPEGDCYIPVVIPESNGNARLFKLKKTVLPTAQAVSKKPDFVFITETVLSFTTTIALGAATRVISKTGLTGVKADDTLLAFLKPGNAMLAGYSMGMAVAKADEQADFPITHPALAINGKFDIPILIYAVRMPK